ncbi:hypothetical protein SAMN05660895_0592 [Thermoflavifilum thermophilum]|uniref:Uncharacterized protein n=2 Tax=Thermoflavifilum thermophilum TaxID=1393122 RepID=A0A1I7N4Q1_9BACT|nr:hypothetical protein SAMN05660895_0592 [Thermoflavifilum thermophilum]
MVSGLIGVCYVCVGLVLFFHKQLHLQFSLDNTFTYVFGAILLIYGMYRVIKSWKSYFSYSGQDR